jgi:hypothetical protein
MSVKDTALLPVEMQPNEYGSGIKGHDSSLIHHVMAVQAPGRMAALLIERWGIVACELDGEDSSGRAKLRRMTVSELVTTACDTADAAWNEFESRGWLLAVPLPTKREAKAKLTDEA